MSQKEMQNRLSFVVFGDDAWRIEAEEKDGKWSVRYDAHGKDVKHAKRDVHNIISTLVFGADLCVIHGYNRGTAIKDMLRTSDFGNRVESMYSPAFNPGITNMHINATT